MRMLFKCLANCFVDVGHGFSKNKIFYEKLTSSHSGAVLWKYFKDNTCQNVFQKSTWAASSEWLCRLKFWWSCIQWVALQIQVLVNLHPVSGSADSGFGELASSEWLCRIRFLVRTSVKGQRNFQRLIWWSFQYNLSRVYQGLAVHPNVNNWGNWRLKPMKNLLFPSLSLKMFWHAKFNQWVALNLVCPNFLASLLSSSEWLWI